MDRQHTIASSVSCAGVGLHSGARVRLTLNPGEPGTGVVFVRTDVRASKPDSDPRIPAHALAVASTQLGTNLVNAQGVSVATVEHFLAACSGLGVDNLVAELDGPELPILDGSSAPFCTLLSEAGLAAQDAPRRRLKILRTVEVRDVQKFARLSPAASLDPVRGKGFEARVAIDFASRAIGRQTISFDMAPGAFVREVAFARTFGFAQDVEKLRSMGLARGGDLDNAIVVDGDTVLNPGGLQVENEFVRHKLLDVVGDLFLAGGPIEGLYEGEQPGHALNNRLLRALFADASAYRWMTGS